MWNVRRKEVYIENHKTHVQNVIGFSACCRHGGFIAFRGSLGVSWEAELLNAVYKSNVRINTFKTVETDVSYNVRPAEIE